MSPRRLALAAAAAAASLLAAAPASATPLVNLALTASATNAPAATDGNAATTWCPSGGEGEVTVDLGRKQRLEGFGVSLAGDAASAHVTIDAGGRRVAADVPVGTPAWVRSTPVSASRVRLSVSGSTCVAELRAFGRERPLIVGHDLSFAVQEAAAGATYTDRGRAALPERILAAHGANWVRLRLWVDPPAGYSDLQSVLAMARRAKAAGMRILLDPHYSDFWADPQKQPTPAAWAGQDLPTLAATVRAYTRDALNALSAQGTPAQMLQLGNEIRNGILWPTGQLDGTQQRWDALGTLLRAAAAGARDAAGPTPRLVVHYDQGGDNAGSRYFFDNIVAQHVPFDVIGLSYYPFWHGTLSQLQTNLDDLSQRYRRDVAVVETQYGWTLDNGDQENNFLWTPDLLVPGYPATAGGQLGFASDLLSMLAAVPGHRGLGVFYWQPEWIPGVGWQPGAGTPNDNLTLFDFTGHALAGVSFADPLRACADYAPGQSPCSF
jgi:arabinogalactan endo-1,4-beta-galactosidase